MASLYPTSLKSLGKRKTHYGEILVAQPFIKENERAQ
jgi:hypothetical protein